MTRGWLGAQVQPVTSGIADSLGLESTHGALVDEAQADSPAAKAGVRSGDVITAIDGKPIKDSRQLARNIAAFAPGSSVTLELVRKGETKNVTVALGTAPNTQQANAEEPQTHGKQARTVPHLGLAVAPAAEVAGSGNKGVVVTEVDPDGSAAEHGLRTGDVILDVAGNAINSAADIRAALSDAKSAGKHDVLVRIKSAEAMRFVALPIG